MRELLMSVGILGMLASISGCATILSGTTQKVNITTETGKRTTVLVDGQRYEAPTIAELKREKKDKIVKPVECPEQEVLLKSEINYVTLGNLIFGGLLGFTTDYASGAMWRYVPDNVSVKCPQGGK